MRLIRSVQIQRFRSCEAATLRDLGDVVAIVGPNNVGKSNILRALNLFFNEETERDSVLDFDVDFRLRPPTSKKKKSIRICVEFWLPEKFRFRQGLEAVESLLGRHCWIAKIWTPLPDPYAPQFEISHDGHAFRRADPDEALRINQFLNLISFRYIPNRAIPAEVIREESPDVLRRLARGLLKAGGTSAASILDNLSEVARQLAEPIAADLTGVCVGITDLELSTPVQILDMLGVAGFKSRMGGLGKVDDTALGAGVQSLLMFHVLYVIDHGQFQGFGWKQAAVWAVEEPESSLHRQLQVWLAGLLRKFARGEESRFQILSTTHNDVFVYGATSGYSAVLDKSLATVVEGKAIEEVASWSTDYGVTGWAAPVLKFPTDTVVLVEGKHDCAVLKRAAELTGVGTQLMFCTPSQLDPSMGGDGWDQQREFVAKHAPYVAHRLPMYPLLVLVDWDRSAAQVASLSSKYGPGGKRNVTRMETAWADARVGQSFRGIERFYSADFLERADRAGIAEIGTTSNGRFVVERGELERAKSRLAEFFVAQAERSDCEHLVPALRWASSIE